MRHRTILLAATVATALAIGSTAANAQKELIFGSVDRPGTPIGDAIEEGMKPTIEKETGGKLTVKGHYFDLPYLRLDLR